MDGIASCPKCHGEGVIPLEDPSMITPAFTRCKCAELKRRFDLMERRWPGLSKATGVDTSPLAARINKNTRITATDVTLKKHLRAIALRQPSSWVYTVESDRELAGAWLYNAKVEGIAYDGDVISHAPRYSRLEDLSDFPSLLILMVGVKAARNAASPELLLDVCRGRDFQGKATWVVDDPRFPWGIEHVSYSDQVDGYIRPWDLVTLDGDKVAHREGGSSMPSASRASRHSSYQPLPASHRMPAAVVEGDDELSRLMMNKGKPKWKGK